MKKATPEEVFRLYILLSLFWLAGPLLTAALAQAPPPDLKKPPADARREPSGLVSKVLEAGTGSEKPDANDMVSAHFTGWRGDGEVFMNSLDKGQPGVFQLDRVFPGWREGLQMMVVGEKRRLWIPPSLGPANAQGDGLAVFDVELLAIQPIPNPPPNLQDPPSGARRLSKGAYSRVLEKGTGTAKPKPTEAVLVSYTGWTTDGIVFDSTIPRFRPTLIPLEKVMPAFAECAQQMVKGEKRLCWIPEQVAQRNWSGAPKGTLTFQVELLEIMDPSKFMKEGAPDKATPMTPGKP